MKKSPLIASRLPLGPRFIYKGISFMAVSDDDLDLVSQIPQGAVGGIILVFRERGVRITSAKGSRATRGVSVNYSSPRQVWVETLKKIAVLLGLPNWRDVEYSGTVNDWIVEEWTRIRGGVR